MNNQSRPFPTSNFYVTQLRRLVLLFTAWNVIRVWTAISWREALDEYSVQPGMWYNLLSGILWMIVGLVVWWMLAREKPGTRKWLLVTSAAYTVWFWGETLFFSQPRVNWPFVLGVNLVILILIYSFSNFIEERGV